MVLRKIILALGFDQLDENISMMILALKREAPACETIVFDELSNRIKLHGLVPKGVQEAAKGSMDSGILALGA